MLVVEWGGGEESWFLIESRRHSQIKSDRGSGPVLRSTRTERRSQLESSDSASSNAEPDPYVARRSPLCALSVHSDTPLKKKKKKKKAVVHDVDSLDSEASSLESCRVVLLLCLVCVYFFSIVFAFSFLFLTLLP